MSESIQSPPATGAAAATGSDAAFSVDNNALQSALAAMSGALPVRFPENIFFLKSFPIICSFFTSL